MQFKIEHWTEREHVFAVQLLIQTGSRKELQKGFPLQFKPMRRPFSKRNSSVDQARHEEGSAFVKNHWANSDAELSAHVLQCI